MNDWITAGEAARILGYSDSRSVTRTANKGYIESKRHEDIPYKRLYLRSSVEDFKKWKQGPKFKGQIPKAKQKIFSDIRQDEIILETESTSIRTLEEALEVADVDMDLWEVERHVINSWDVSMKIKQEDGTDTTKTVTNYQVKVWLKPRIKAPLKEAIEELIKEIPSLPCLKRSPIPTSKFALELCPFDAHIGKLAWAKETGQKDYDLQIALKGYTDAIAYNLEYSTNFEVSKIFFIIGQDLLHIENYQHKTPLAGHELDTDSRFIKIYTGIKKATIQAVRMCTEVAPVEVVWIPGNHDMHASFFLTEILGAAFSQDKWISVDNAPKWRKAKIWGNLLVAWTHDASGNKAKPTINNLPQFWPELWGQSKYREWHCGHKHKKHEEKYYPTLTVGGTIIRQIPTMSEIDAWHYQNLFTDAVPACESFVWTEDAGVVAHYTANMEAVRNET